MNVLQSWSIEEIHFTAVCKWLVTALYYMQEISATGWAKNKVGTNKSGYVSDRMGNLGVQSANRLQKTILCTPTQSYSGQSWSSQRLVHGQGWNLSNETFVLATMGYCYCVTDFYGISLQRTRFVEEGEDQVLRGNTSHCDGCRRLCWHFGRSCNSKQDWLADVFGTQKLFYVIQHRLLMLRLIPLQRHDVV